MNFNRFQNSPEMLHQTIWAFYQEKSITYFNISPDNRWGASHIQQSSLLCGGLTFDSLTYSAHSQRKVWEGKKEDELSNREKLVCGSVVAQRLISKNSLKSSVFGLQINKENTNQSGSANDIRHYKQRCACCIHKTSDKVERFLCVQCTFFRSTPRARAYISCGGGPEPKRERFCVGGGGGGGGQQKCAEGETFARMCVYIARTWIELLLFGWRTQWVWCNDSVFVGAGGCGSASKQTRLLFSLWI